jgi:hypothetical protein
VPRSRVYYFAEAIKNNFFFVCGESSATGLQLRVCFLPAALLAMPRTALAPQHPSAASAFLKLEIG